MIEPHSNGVATLSINGPERDGLNTIGLPAHPSARVRTTVPVKTVKLDDWVANSSITHVDVIKIDVEGAEYLVFSGASKLLARPDAPLILFEVGDLSQLSFGHAPETIIAFLEGLGYQVTELSNDGSIHAVTRGNALRCTLIAVKPK